MKGIIMYYESRVQRRNEHVTEMAKYVESFFCFFFVFYLLFRIVEISGKHFSI